MLIFVNLIKRFRYDEKLLACIALGCIATANSYAGTPLWMRDVQISPDGKEIVFVIKGIFIRCPPKEALPPNSPHRVLTNVHLYGRPMEKR